MCNGTAAESLISANHFDGRCREQIFKAAIAVSQTLRAINTMRSAKAA
jgi:hypothetical protein